MSIFYRAVWIAIRGVASVWFRLEPHGAENLPATGGFVLAANHASNLDPPLISVSMWRECHTLAKQELFDIPLIGKAIRRLHSHPINRAGVDRRALRECAELLTSGEILLLFPEGTRTEDGQFLPAKPGAGMIAAQAGVPIVPVYIEGSFDAMPRGVNLPRPRKVRVRFGKPFLPDEVLGEGGRREKYQALADAMMQRIAGIREAALR